MKTPARAATRPAPSITVSAAPLVDARCDARTGITYAQLWVLLDERMKQYRHRVAAAENATLEAAKKGGMAEQRALDALSQANWFYDTLLSFSGSVSRCDADADVSPRHLQEWFHRMPPDKTGTLTKTLRVTV